MAALLQGTHMGVPLHLPQRKCANLVWFDLGPVATHEVRRRIPSSGSVEKLRMGFNELFEMGSLFIGQRGREFYLTASPAREPLLA